MGGGNAFIPFTGLLLQLLDGNFVIDNLFISFITTIPDNV